MLIFSLTVDSVEYGRSFVVKVVTFSWLQVLERKDLEYSSFENLIQKFIYPSPIFLLCQTKLNLIFSWRMEFCALQQRGLYKLGG